MKLLGSANKDVDKDKDGENVPKLEYVENVLMHCNLVNNSYQQSSKLLFTFVPHKQFGQLITISPHLLTMLQTANAEFQSIQGWFTDQNNRLLIKMRYSTEPKYRKYVKDTAFCHLQEDLEMNMVKN